MLALSNLRLIALTTAAVLCFTAGWHINGLIWEHRSDSMLEEQKSLLIGQCNDDKKTTEEIDNATLAKLRTRDDRVADYKRLHPTATCLPVASTSGNGNAAGGRNIDGGPHAVTDHALLDYAAVAEQHRVQLVGCQKFVKKVWEQQ